MSVPLSEVRDLDFANDASKVLESTVRKLQYGNIAQNERRYAGKPLAAQASATQPPSIKSPGHGTSCPPLTWSLGLALLPPGDSRFVTKLLEDLVFFVCEAVNNGQDVLSVAICRPNRERQKLMREQNILAQV